MDNRHWHFLSLHCLVPPLALLLTAQLLACGEVVSIAGSDAARPPDGGVLDTAVGVEIDSGRPPPPDALPADASGSPTDSAPCVAYDFETTGQHLVERYILERAELSGTSYLTWTADPALDRRGFGIDGGDSDWIDVGERLVVTWSGAPRLTSVTYYPGNVPVRLYLTWTDRPSTIVEMDVSGTYAWTTESPTSIGLEPTSSASVALRRLSYCP